MLKFEYVTNFYCLGDKVDLYYLLAQSASINNQKTISIKKSCANSIIP